jgi:hypothetical protein
MRPEVPPKIGPLGQNTIGDVLDLAHADAARAAAIGQELQANPGATIGYMFQLTPAQRAGLQQVPQDELDAFCNPVGGAIAAQTPVNVTAIEPGVAVAAIETDAATHRVYLKTPCFEFYAEW